MKNKLTSGLLLLAMSAGVVSAQTSKVTGKVIGEDGEPVIGAAIIVKGTTVGTVTDYDGNFSLNVPAEGKHLVVSFIGMKSQEIAVKPQVSVKLMADTQDLDEVVVTAMGIKRERKALGYAAQDLKSDELNKAGTTSLASAIQGKLTGVEIRQSSGAPGASSQITIRGARSFDGNNQPLYVIDQHAGRLLDPLFRFGCELRRPLDRYQPRRHRDDQRLEGSGRFSVVWYPCF